MEYLVNFENVFVTYDRFTALANINLSLPKAQKIAIVGPNGAGKSTLLQAAVGLIPYRGHVQLLEGSPKKMRERIAYIPQRSNVNWDFPITVEEVVLMGITGNRWGWQRTSKSDRQKAWDALETMQLFPLKDKQINQLSGGQKQRTFIARALTQNVDAYFLDEPLAGVDKLSEEIIMSQLEKFKKQGKSSVTVHHHLESLNDYFDYLVLINQSVISHGPIEEILSEDNLAKTYRFKKE